MWNVAPRSRRVPASRPRSSALHHALKRWNAWGDRAGMGAVALRIAGIREPLYHSMANLPSRPCHTAVRSIAPDYSSARGGTPYEVDACDLCELNHRR